MGESPESKKRTIRSYSPFKLAGEALVAGGAVIGAINAAEQRYTETVKLTEQQLLMEKAQPSTARELIERIKIADTKKEPDRKIFELISTYLHTGSESAQLDPKKSIEKLVAAKGEALLDGTVSKRALDAIDSFHKQIEPYLPSPQKEKPGPEVASL